MLRRFALYSCRLRPFLSRWGSRIEPVGAHPLRWLFVLALLASRIAASTVSELTVAESPSPQAFALVGGGRVADVIVEPGEAKVVSLSAQLFAADVGRVTGEVPAVMGDDDLAKRNRPAAVLVGTLGHNRLIDGLAASGKLDVSAIQSRWEAFAVAVVDNPTPGVKRALVVAGSDRRGTAYGLFTLSQAIGVSPWYWWADVPPTHHAALYLSLASPLHDAPAVKYRGIFINDEDWGINPWAKETFDPPFHNIGPKTYAKVFELMLRLRLNYLWPAMHWCTTAFGSVPENVSLADDYGIVAGSSHCEQMLYNNIRWNEKTSGPWNYSTNRDAVHAIWETTAKARGRDEAVWTLGIRGIHDGPMQTPPSDLPGKIDLLTQIIADQRALLEQDVTRQWGPVAQCFIPYKEVQPIYDAGLKVPEDVTLVWADDNFGYLRRLSSPAERRRSGGAGVYYHISYYGGPHAYTWINTTSPALMWEELHKAWENEARTIWMLNVGDIKPMEIGIDYYARLAWDPQAQGPDSQPRFLRDFAANFGGSTAPAIADLLMAYYRLGTVRKPELMNRGWALSLPSDRAAQLAHDYAALLQSERAIADAVPAPARDAYTETVGFPCRLLGSTGLLFMADRSAQRGDDAPARQQEIIRLRDDMTREVNNYNTSLASGKWNHMMPGLVTAKDLTSCFSEVRWPWGEESGLSSRSPADVRETNEPPPDHTWHDAATATREPAEGVPTWHVIDGLGASGRAVALLPVSLPLPSGADNARPTLTFSFVAPGGPADALLDFLPTIRLYPGMKLRVAVAIDHQPSTLVEVPGSGGNEDEGGYVRSNAVQDNSTLARVPLPSLAAGPHTFTVSGVDPGVVLDRVRVP